MKSIIVKNKLYCLDNLWWAEINHKFADASYITLHYVNGHGLNIDWLKPKEAEEILVNIQKILAE